MSRLFSLKSVGLSILAAALTVSFSPNAAVAQDASVVKTVPAIGAPALITEQVDLDHQVPSGVQLGPDTRNATDLGPAPADMKMTMQLELRRSPRQEQAVHDFLHASQDPSSKTFGQTMMPEPFASQFGLAKGDLDTLRDVLTAGGFTVGNVDNGRLTINFSGTVEQVNEALTTSIHLFKDSTGTERYAPAAGWNIPEALAPVVADIKGLDNFSPVEFPNFSAPVSDFAGVSADSILKNGKAPREQVVAKLDGELLPDASFTASSAATVFASHDATLLNVRLGGGDYPVNGKLQIVDMATGKTIAYVPDITLCEGYNNGLGRNCTFSFTPSVATTSYLKAIYSGDDNYRGLFQVLVHPDVGTGASTTVSSWVPNDFYSTTGGAVGGTINVAISWLGSGTQPTGTLLVYDNKGGTSYTEGGITLPAAGSTTIAAGTACTTASISGGTCTYSCTGSLAGRYLACSLSESNIYAALYYYLLNQQDVSYSGDANYAAATGTGITWVWLQDAAAASSPTMTATASTPATITYGAATTESNTVNFTGNSTQGAIFTGSSTAAGTSTDEPLLESTNPQLGTMKIGYPSTCTATTGICAYANTFTVPANATPGSYTVTYEYSGRTYQTASYGYASTTSSITVSQQQATFGAVTAAPTSVRQGSSTNVVLSFTIIYTGSGDVPNTTSSNGGSIPTVTLNGMSYNTTCTGTASPLTCSATVPAATIAMLAPGGYPITGSWAGDVNYLGGTPTAGTFTVLTPTTATMTSPVSTAPQTEPYDGLTAFTVSGQIAYTTATVPSTSGVSFTSTAAGTFGTVTCTGSSSPISCSATFTPTATDVVGSYNINIAYAGDSANGASSSSQVGNFVIGPGAFTTEQMTTSAYATPPTATTEAYGATTPFSVYATFSPSGTVAPTGADVVFTVTGGSATGTFGTATCTVVTGVAHCTAMFMPSGMATPGSYNINVSFSGDSNYGASGTSTNGTGLYVVTNATPTVTFNPSPITSISGSTTPITITVTVSNSYTGVVNFTGSYATYGTLSATSCTITVAGAGCTVTFTPNGTTAVGTYTSILTATTAAFGYYNSASANDNLVIAKQGTYLAVTVTPIAYFDAVSSGAHTVVLSWTNPALEPTGTIAITDTTAANRSIGTITLSPTGAAIASTSCTTAGSVGTCTYTCAAKVDLAISCTVTNTATSGKATTTVVADVADGNAMLATYSGDSNFASATANTYLYDQSSYAANGGAATITLSGTAIANATYGLTTAEGPTVSITGASSDPPSDSTFPFLDITSTGATGTMYEINLQPCSTDPCVTATSWTFPAVVAPGTYSLSYNYSGNYQSSSGQTDQTTLTSGSVVVSKGTTSMGTVTFSPASSEPYGTNQAITISDTLQYLGVGEAPQGAVTFTLNAVPYTATCTLTSISGSGNSQTNIETCSATVSGMVIAALQGGNYTVSGIYTADTNYGGASGTNGIFTITPATTTLTLSDSSPGTTSLSPVGGVTSTTIVATSSLAVPNGTLVTFTDNTTGATATAPTTSNVASITVTTSTAGVSAGLNNVSASIAATTNTSAATSTNTQNIYLQGILFSFIGTHNFSGLLTGSANPYSCCSSGVEGTVDGTAAPAYGVSVVNFTTAAQTLPVTLSNASSGAFSLNNECGSTLTSGETCSLAFDYAPPAGDGCTPAEPVTGSSCTLDTSGYPQGTYEQATWMYSLPMGVIAGLGNEGFTTSGVAATSGTLAGKALLQPLGLSVSPTTVNFGSQVQGYTSQTITVTVTNTNNSAVPFTVSGPAGSSASAFTVNNTCGNSLAANTSCSIFISMVTSATGTFNGDTLTITPSGGSAINISLSGTVAAANTGITLSSNNHNFGNVTDGTTVTFSTTLTNNTAGTATLAFSNSAGAGYMTSTTCGTSLAASARCGYTFTFSPTTTGASSDTLTITSNVPILPSSTGGDTGTVTASGTGVVGGHLTATSVTHNFGDIAVGTSAGNYGVEITNSTSAAVTLSFSGLTGGAAGFTLVGENCPATLAINGSCELVFSFTPTGTGFVSGTYPITSSSPLYFNGNPAMPSQITLEGTGQ